MKIETLNTMISYKKMSFEIKTNMSSQRPQIINAKKNNNMLAYLKIHPQPHLFFFFIETAIEVDTKTETLGTNQPL